jgi:hypothetical protein
MYFYPVPLKNPNLDVIIPLKKFDWCTRWEALKFLFRCFMYTTVLYCTFWCTYKTSIDKTSTLQNADTTKLRKQNVDLQNVDKSFDVLYVYRTFLYTTNNRL